MTVEKEAQSLTNDDIRQLFAGFADAIQLDQIRVDALPREKFNFKYSDSMWRTWRRSHVDYVNRLLPTVEAISPTLLEELTWLATNYGSAAVRQAALELFADAASENCEAEEVETAALFFGWLIQGVTRASKGKPNQGEARALMMNWLPVTDPLRIAEDQECGYGVPSGFVN
jgi:hypothetical protein